MTIGVVRLEKLEYEKKLFCKKYENKTIFN
jgi:hypothetical protein